MDQYLESVVSPLLLTLDSPVCDQIVSFHSPAHRQYQFGETGLKGYYGFLQSDTQIIVLPQTKVHCLHESFVQGNVYSNCSLVFFNVLVNCKDNKNSHMLVFYFLLWLSITAARAFV